MKLVDIEQYILKVLNTEEDFKHIPLLGHKKDNKIQKNNSETPSLVYYFLFFVRCLFDFLHFKLWIVLRPHEVRSKNIVYTVKNFCTKEGNVYEDRVVKSIHLENILFINYGKDYSISKINGRKVYNFGGLIKLLTFIQSRKKSYLIRTFISYRIINESILKHLKNTRVFTLCFYDLNGFSLSFSKHRENFILSEVQHGSIINYPPYLIKSPIKIADSFYVKNDKTIRFLKENLNSGFSDITYQKLPYLKNTNLFVKEGYTLLYASTIEFKGLHPVFRHFLKTNTLNNLHIKIRLHPRELDKKNEFEVELKEYNVSFEFDLSKNWLEANSIKNLIVVSPWSSTIEDAVDNDFKALIIDPVGKERYKHLIDEKNCFYTKDISSTLKLIT